HQQHAGDWVLRLGGGTDESHRRLQDAVDLLWRYLPEIFESDSVDDEASSLGLGPRWADLEAEWVAEVVPVLDEAGLVRPAARRFRSTGKTGVHSEHMGFILAEMQSLQRAHPGGVW
ncbi:MAG: Phenylacetic acid catabolic protein, partial [Caldimonas sp.]